VAPWITVLSWHTVFIKRVIYYKFAFVWYSVKQGTTHIPTSHLTHLYTLPFLWPREDHRWQSSWVDFAGHCLLWLLLLRLAAVVVPLLLIFPQNSLLMSLAFAPDSEAMSATRISLMAPSWSFIYLFIFFWPLLETYNRLPCLDYYVWLGKVSKSNTSEIWTSSTVTAIQV